MNREHPYELDPVTGDPALFESFEQLFAAFEKQLAPSAVSMETVISDPKETCVGMDTSRKILEGVGVLEKFSPTKSRCRKCWR